LIDFFARGLHPVPAPLGPGDHIAQSRAGDGLGIEVDQVAELRHQFR